MATKQNLNRFAEQFWADEQKRAEAVGMNAFEYLMQAEDGILRPTVLKMLHHAKDHPNACPSDCAFQRSLERLKRKHGIVA